MDLTRLHAILNSWWFLPSLFSLLRFRSQNLPYPWLEVRLVPSYVSDHHRFFHFGIHVPNSNWNHYKVVKRPRYYYSSCCRQLYHRHAHWLLTPIICQCFTSELHSCSRYYFNADIPRCHWRRSHQLDLDLPSIPLAWILSSSVHLWMHLQTRSGSSRGSRWRPWRAFHWRRKR